MRRAWTDVVTADDYDAHMAAIGQAQAAAQLTGYLMESARLRPGSRISFAGAGTGQVLDFLDAGAFRPYRLVFSDLNPNFLAVLRARLTRLGLTAKVVEDDIEETRLEPNPDLVVASLLLEQIDWPKGVAALAELRPGSCGIIIQENPDGMSTPLTPGRSLPPSIAEAARMAEGSLVGRQELVTSMSRKGYACCDSACREVADGKRLLGLLFARQGSGLGPRIRESRLR
jgi:hypothetical protein